MSTTTGWMRLAALTLAVLAATSGFLPAGAAAEEDFETVVKAAAEQTELSLGQVRQVLEYVPELVGYELAQGNEVVLDDFGTFFVCEAADGEKTVCFAPESERRSSGAQTRTKGEITAQIENRTGLTRSVLGKLLDIIFDTISGSVESEQKFSYPGFGTFTVKHRKARFEPAPALKDVVN